MNQPRGKDSDKRPKKFGTKPDVGNGSLLALKTAEAGASPERVVSLRRATAPGGSVMLQRYSP
jgi:hypothetical protein